MLHYAGRDGLLIANITDGRIMDWNMENPDRSIMLGDCIREVDGVCGDTKRMLSKVKSLVHSRKGVRIRLQSRLDVDFDPELRLALLSHLQTRDLGLDDLELLAMLDSTANVGSVRDETHGQSNKIAALVDALPRLPAGACPADECAVCLADFGPDSLVTRLPCRHYYCTRCITTWLTEHESHCPLCLRPIAEHEIVSFDPLFDADSDVDRIDECVSIGPLPTLPLSATGNRKFGQRMFIL